MARGSPKSSSWKKLGQAATIGAAVLGSAGPAHQPKPGDNLNNEGYSTKTDQQNQDETGSDHYMPLGQETPEAKATAENALKMKFDQVQQEEATKKQRIEQSEAAKQENLMAQPGVAQNTNALLRPDLGKEKAKQILWQSWIWFLPTFGLSFFALGWAFWIAKNKVIVGDVCCDLGEEFLPPGLTFKSAKLPLVMGLDVSYISIAEKTLLLLLTAVYGYAIIMLATIIYAGLRTCEFAAALGYNGTSSQTLCKLYTGLASGGFTALQWIISLF